MFFIQQANSLKNSSQISQRKHLHKNNPAQFQTRGGDTISHGGLTSATTYAVPTDALSNENRSGIFNAENNT
jgi:hypothetical protein